MHYVGIAVLIVIALMLLHAYLIQRRFRIVSYRVTLPAERFPSDSKVKRLLVVADLHNHCYGEHNENLLNAIEEAAPDMVLIPGDLTVCGSDKNYVTFDFLERLSKLSIPVLYSLGNHEDKMRVEFPEQFDELTRLCAGLDIRLLDNECVEPAEGICVAGLTIPRDCYRKGFSTKHIKTEDVRKRLGASEPGKMLVMLAHNPVYFEQYASYGADLVISGHMHGGIMKLPLLGGVISPQWRLFPKYDGGLYMLDNSKMVVSRGLGLHTLPVRFFQSPELVLIELEHCD